MRLLNAALRSAALSAGLSTAAPLIEKRDFQVPGFLNPLSGAIAPFTCTAAAPCGVANDPAAAATFYTIKDPTTGKDGITACGYNDPNKIYTDVVLNDDVDHFIALSANMMGTLSTGDVVNPVCGQKITVTNTKTGTTLTAPVVDKCPGCKSNWGLDMSPHLYERMGGTVADGTFPISWFWA